MKLGLLSKIIICGLLSVNTYAQEYGPFHFDKLPSNKQLFAREADNMADVIVSGKVDPSAFTAISMVKFRNNTRTGYTKSNLTYNENNAAPFSLTTKIKAELAEYAIEVYGIKSATDSSLLVKREDIVGGDFYIIYGQSNAVAWEVDYKYRHEYARSMGTAPEIGTVWGLSNDLGPRVGTFGIEFQKQIAERYKIPTCVINGALAGASIDHLLARNANDHFDTGTAYGALLTYARNTGLLPKLKGIFYWQGEAEAASPDPLSWAPKFDLMVKQWAEDYPMVEKIYVFQLPLFGGGSYDDRIGEFREQQRTLNLKYPIIQPYAALGAPGWNGFHYVLDGYLTIGKELADMAGYYHYGKTEKITSPSFQKAYYSTPERDEITMVFEDYQEMIYPNDTLNVNIEGSLEPESIYAVKDFFYLNKQWQKLKSGRAEANKIIVNLKEVGNDTLIKYLPSKYHYSNLLTAPWVYIGPFLRNKLGFRALAFHHNKIFPYQDLGKPNLTVSEVNNNVVLSWNLLPKVDGYQVDIIERKDSTEKHIILYLPADQTSYTYKGAIKDKENTYKIRGYTIESETSLSVINYTKVSQDDVISGIENSNYAISVYPNPTSDLINIYAENDFINGIDLISTSGITVKSLKYDAVNFVPLNLSSTQEGTYILRISIGNKSVTKQVVVRH